MDSFYNFLPILGIMCVAGISAGFLAGLLGVGGGIIFVPVLHIIFTSFFKMNAGDSISLATATSLLCMIPTTLSSCLAHFKKQNVDTALVKRWIVFLIIGIICGRLLSGLYGGLWLSVLFGCILLLAAANMILFANKKALFDSLPSLKIQRIIAFFIGSISVMLGIGGGTLTVPTLTLFNFDPKKAIGSAACIGFLISIPGAVVTIITDLMLYCFDDNFTKAHNAPPLTLGHVCFLAVIAIIPFSMAVAPLGVKVNKLLNPITIKRLFALLLIFTGTKMLLGGLQIF